MAGVARLRKALAVLLRDLEHTVDGFGQDLSPSRLILSQGRPGFIRVAQLAPVNGQGAPVTRSLVDGHCRASRFGRAAVFTAHGGEQLLEVQNLLLQARQGTFTLIDESLRGAMQTQQPNPEFVIRVAAPAVSERLRLRATRVEDRIRQSERGRIAGGQKGLGLSQQEYRQLFESPVIHRSPKDAIIPDRLTHRRLLDRLHRLALSLVTKSANQFEKAFQIARKGSVKSLKAK